MISVFTTLTFCMLWATGFSQSVLITQWPPYISRLSSGLAEMHCYQNNTDYQYLYWYRKGGKGFQLIVYIVAGNANFEEGFKSGFQAESKDKKWSLTISSIQKEDEAVYLCAASTARYQREAYFGQGTKLTVLESGRRAEPPTVKVLPPSLNECRNKKDSKRKKTLVCVASKFYPDHVSVSWQIDGEDVTKDVATDDAALRPEGERNYTITSRLRVSAESWFTPTRKFKCVVKFYNGNDYKTYEDSINGVEAPAKGNAITREKYLRVTQTAKLSYAVFIVKSSIYGAFVAFLVWKLQGKQNN